jgi:acyl-CoA thioesterase YciA
MDRQRRAEQFAGDQHPMADRYLALKAVMMPRDTNPQGTIFGGVLLSYIDQAAAIGALYEMHRLGAPQRPIVTVAMNKVEFHHPVFVGDVVSFYTTMLRLGRTSITMHVSVEVERRAQKTEVTEAEVVYVAVEMTPEGRKPVPILPEGAGRPAGPGAKGA